MYILSCVSFFSSSSALCHFSHSIFAFFPCSPSLTLKHFQASSFLLDPSFFLMPPRKSTRNKGKGIALSSMPIDSENSLPPSSPISYDSCISSFKRATPSHYLGDMKKTCKFDTESSLDMKDDFWNSFNESVFQNLKSKIIMYGKIMDLDLLLPIHCPIKEFLSIKAGRSLFFFTQSCL